jgi:hypothetical protein
VVEKPDDTPAEEATAFVTGMMYGDGGWQMAVRMSDSGKMRYFRQGDSIEIGRFSGEIVELDGRRAIITRDEQLVQVHLGQNLGQAVALADQAS